jgi:hypothetical protein
MGPDGSHIDVAAMGLAVRVVKFHDFCETDWWSRVRMQ